jgi:hypothetical protein
VRQEQYTSFDELLATIADEPCQATIDGKVVTMTQRERLFRVMIDRATRGNVREITRLLHIMAKDPGLAATSRTQSILFINGALARA